MTVDSHSANLASARSPYGAFEMATGELVIYDRDNPDAWIKSTLAWSLEDARPSTSTAGRV